MTSSTGVFLPMSKIRLVSAATSPCRLYPIPSEEDDGARSVEFSQERPTHDQRLVIDRSGGAANITFLPLSPLVDPSATVHGIGVARRLVLNADGVHRPKARSQSQSKRRRAATPHSPERHSLPPRPVPEAKPATARSSFVDSDEDDPAPSVVPPRWTSSPKQQSRPATPRGRSPPRPRPAYMWVGAWHETAGYALECAAKIVDDTSGVGLPDGSEKWMDRIRETIQKGPHFKVEEDWWPAACPRICFCVPNYKRTWQLEQCLAINLILGWALREKVCFVFTSVTQSRCAPIFCIEYLSSDGRW